MSVPTRRILKPIFGEPLLEAGNNGRASWTTVGLRGSQQVTWAAKLDAGKQTGWNDYAKVVISVDEMRFTDLESVVLEAYYTATEGADIAVCVYIHDPTDLDERAEISHTSYTTTAAGWRELDFPTEPGGSSWFYYGDITTTPDTCPTKGTGYTWAQFQADSTFKTFTIYKITLDYGYLTGDSIMNGCYLTQCKINNQTILIEPSLKEQIALISDRTADALRNIPTWTFGKPTLSSANNGKARWIRGSTSPLDQKSSTGWLASLYGGVQTGDDWARVNIPVNELPVPNLTAAMWSYHMSAAETMGVNMVVWVHDPADFDIRAEITQRGNVAGLEKTAGWNAHELNTATTQFFYYGEISGTPDTTPTAGTLYTWAQFQADDIFSTYTIYRITFEYGWEASGTFNEACVADIKINGEMIPLTPSSTTHRKIVSVTKTLLAATAYHATDVLCETATDTEGTDWDFDFGGTGYITLAKVVSETTALTPRLTLQLYSFPPTCELDDHATSTGPIIGDIDTFIGQIDMPAMTSIGTGLSYAVATPSTYGNLPLMYDVTKIYVVALTNDAFTQGAGKKLKISLGADMEDN